MLNINRAALLKLYVNPEPVTAVLPLVETATDVVSNAKAFRFGPVEVLPVGITVGG